MTIDNSQFTIDNSCSGKRFAITQFTIIVQTESNEACFNYRGAADNRTEFNYSPPLGG